ncbi:MAG: DUF1704 domain-containing protein [Candidatus Electrothrix scaldis]|nr:MAG: DUF1704 domain-containing protein [Candidatus Electrothrix sp. GW3-3]
MNLEHIKNIEKEWESIDSSYRITPYNAPINREEEKKKVLRAYQCGGHYNPQFTYLSPPEYPVDRLRSFMSKLRPEFSSLEEVYYEKVRNALLQIETIQNHNPNYITGLSCLSFGLPDTDLIESAFKIFGNKTAGENREPLEFSSNDAVIFLQNVLKKMGLKSWQAISFSPMSAKVSVNRIDKQIKVQDGAEFSKSEVVRLVVHEIGVHVLRYENGAKQPIRLFRNSFPQYIGTEEGLAVFCEEKAGLLAPETLRKYSGRAIATHLSLTNNFYDVFFCLADELGAELAFDITARVKRGFTDTSRHGAHTKDMLYLQGYLSVKKHLEKKPDDYELLFIGKFGLQHIGLVRDLLKQEVISPAQLLPSDLPNN